MNSIKNKDLINIKNNEKDLSEKNTININYENNKGSINILNITFLDKKEKNNYTWHKHIIYEGKKFYLMNKEKYAIKSNELKYFCNNNNTYKNSTNAKRHSICKCQIIFNKKDNKYYYINGHTNECLNIKNKKYENIGNINKEITKYNEFKNILKDILNKEPLLNFTNFKERAEDIFRENKYEFELKTNTIKNIYYTWRNNSFIFKKYSIFENNLTTNNKIFLRDYINTFIYKSNGNGLYHHEHAIFASPFQINKISASPHLYIDGTFVNPNEFSQLLVILYYDREINKKCP